MRTLSVALGTLLIYSANAFAKSQIISEFELHLPRQFQEVLITKKWESLMNKEFQGNWQIPDQKTVTDGIPVQMKNISLAVKSFMEKPRLEDPQNALLLTAKDLRAELKLGEVSIDHVIERSVGGIVGRFRVQALCHNVALQLAPDAGNFSLVLNPQVDSTSIGLNVQDVHLSWAPGAWVASEIKCSGAEGFSEVLKKEIERIANDSESLVSPHLSTIKTKIQESLKDSTYDYTSEKELNVARPDIRIFMLDLKYENLGTQGVRMKGNLHVNFLLSKKEDIKNLKLDKSTQVLGAEAQLRLPKDFISEFAMQAYTAETWLHRIVSTKISGFNSLMQSRFSQFFVWPELMSYPRSAQFLFDVNSPTDISIKGGGLKYRLESLLFTRMWAPKNGSYIPFMSFTTPLKNDLFLSVNQGKLNLQFKKVDLALSAKWDPQYLSKYSPSTRFSKSTIRDRLATSLEGLQTNILLPKIPVIEGLSLQINKVLSPVGEDLVVRLK